MHLLLTWIAIKLRVKYKSTQIYKGAMIKFLLQHTLSEMMSRIVDVLSADMGKHPLNSVNLV
jgi:hypothetical protein